MTPMIEAGYPKASWPQARPKHIQKFFQFHSFPLLKPFFPWAFSMCCAMIEMNLLQRVENGHRGIASFQKNQTIEPSDSSSQLSAMYIPRGFESSIRMREVRRSTRVHHLPVLSAGNTWTKRGQSHLSCRLGVVGCSRSEEPGIPALLGQSIWSVC